MLTSYLVHCPHAGCEWFGSLLPCRNQDSWREAVPTTNLAVFECPHCGRIWRARIQGDDVVPLVEEQAAPVG
jgi:hypothetical protein